MSYSQKSRQTSKKVKKRELGFTPDEVDECKAAFDLFDTDNSGVIFPHDLKNAMMALGFEVKNPVVYEIISELDNESNAKKGVTFDAFAEAVNNKLGDKASNEGIEKIYKLFANEDGFIDVDSLRRICRSLGEQQTNEELEAMMERASSDGKTLNLQEFTTLLTKTTFP